MTGAQVIDKLLVFFQLNAKSFSEKIGLDRPQAIYDIQNGKTKGISPRMANKIISAFPEVDKAWLLSGEGNMLKEESVSTNSENTNQQSDDMTVQELLEAIKRRDRQMDEMLSQQGRLIDVIEALSGTSIKQSDVG